MWEGRVIRFPVVTKSLTPSFDKFGYGRHPNVMISNNTTPKDQTSDATVNRPWDRLSGDIQRTGNKPINEKYQCG